MGFLLAGIGSFKIIPSFDAQGYMSEFCVFDGIIQQIEQNLAQTRLIGKQEWGYGFAPFEVDCQAFSVGT
jgi:hypothetical protein